MSATPPESTADPKPIKDAAESLNAMLWAKADAKLIAIIDRHLNLNGLVSDVGSTHGGAWVHVLNLRINGLGAQKEVWAPSLIEAAKEATFLALRDYHRNRYATAFIHKITSMQEELERLQAQVS